MQNGTEMFTNWQALRVEIKSLCVTGTMVLFYVFSVHVFIDAKRRYVTCHHSTLHCTTLYGYSGVIVQNLWSRSHDKKLYKILYVPLSCTTAPHLGPQWPPRTLSPILKWKRQCSARNTRDTERVQLGRRGAEIILSMQF